MYVMGRIDSLDGADLLRDDGDGRGKDAFCEVRPHLAGTTWRIKCKNGEGRGQRWSVFERVREKGKDAFGN
jgi:hypothetical protein